VLPELTIIEANPFFIINPKERHMVNNQGNLNIVAALLTIAIIHRRQEPPAEDDPKGAFKSVLTTYKEVVQILESSPV
jgi:hypothetical protein